MTRIPFDEMKTTIRQAMVNAGMLEDKAEACARIHTESSRDGVFSHGLNRVEKFVDYIRRGWIDVHAEPSLVRSAGAYEVWDGNLGPGVLNAVFAMDRAIEVAKEFGFSILGLNNTTHWMRGGTYGWQAAEKGFMAICWTNTERCMPPWGAKSEAIGNNPFIMAVPRKEGPIVFDMAMSLYSYGKLQVTRLKKEKLPYPGGFDHEGNLTDEPGVIEKTRRILPTGYWKGSGMAVMLDVFAALMAGGLGTPDIDQSGKGSCGRCCQVFIAMDPLRFNSAEFMEHTINSIVQQVKTSEPAVEGQEIFYPGEKSLRTRHDNLRHGIPVDDSVWARVKELAGRG